MFQTLSLILPVLIPSWRFFKTIEPSPRVEWAVFPRGEDAPTVWNEFRPQPIVVTPLQMVLRLFWNPDRNEELFVISCAERIQVQPTQHSIVEITQRVQDDVAKMGLETAGQILQFRLVFVRRVGTELVRDIVFCSDALPALKEATT
ncbi:hypothetical protein [Algirhabdus cladophorae]|uniref:hypothetical protein n=1 Tax=Algirhabdus cladophorae TaxID=3377108 RepID=UPI003B848B13